MPILAVDSSNKVPVMNNLSKHRIRACILLHVKAFGTFCASYLRFWFVSQYLKFYL